jgi:hypothetical protein
MGSLHEENDRPNYMPSYKPRKKRTERTFEKDVIAHLERDLTQESNPARREELQSMLDDWKGFVERF